MAAPEVSLAAPLTENLKFFGINQKRTRDDGLPPGGGEERWPGWPGDNVFRLLVPAHKVGAIIGRKGEFVKKMCEETRSRIKILDGIAGTAERVVMVSAREEPEAVISPAVDGLLKVHQRTIGLIESEGYPNITQAPDGTVSSRLLVAATQAGSLIGKQGATIKSIHDTSGAMVHIMPPEDLPLCALQDDRIVEIHGEPAKVHKAIELAVLHLRKFLVDRSVLPLFELNKAVQAQSQSQITPQTSWASTASANPPSLGGVSHYGTSSLQHNSFYQTSDLLETQNFHHGVSLYGRDPSIGSVAAAPIITQVTQHMQIPLTYADAIIGMGGANISYMRRISGATITIQEAMGYPGEMTVDLQGTSSQVQTAAQLIQNSMTEATAPSTSAYTTAPSGGSVYNTLPSNPYSAAPSNSTYNAVPSGSTYNSVDAGYMSYTPQAPLYSSATGIAGHSTGTYGSYSNAYSY